MRDLTYEAERFQVGGLKQTHTHTHTHTTSFGIKRKETNEK